MTEESPTPVEVDGPGHPFQDSLLDKLLGKWKVTGRVIKEDVRLDCDVEWVLNHQFLKVHFLGQEVEVPAGAAREDRYEALVFLGYDNMSERYVAHWLDIFGGRFSEALGYGHKEGESAIRFVFEYDAPLHNTLSLDEATGSWRMIIRQKNQKGEWTLFAEEFFERAN